MKQMFLSPGEKLQTKVVVKWFNPFRGYGFVGIEGIDEDIFLHFSTIDQVGYKYLEEGDELLCEVTPGGKGYMVSKIISVQQISGEDDPDKKADNPFQSIETVEGHMKWFNPAKGFGFAEIDCSGKDVFIHASLLRKLGVTSIEPGRKLIMKVHTSPRGCEARELVLL